MKRFLYGALAALSLALTASTVHADCSFEYSCSRHFGYTRTSKNRCFSWNGSCNPLPCAGGNCASGPAPWNALPAYGPPAYGAPPYGYPAPVAAAPPVAAPVAPTFKAPVPTPATINPSGLQQAGYFYYGQTVAPNYGYDAGYNYGANYGANYGYSYYGYGTSYAQAPNYWY